MLRDGDVLIEFVKGDMYLCDMNYIKGYVGEVMIGIWYLIDQNFCIMIGFDSILRIWDVNNKWSQKEVIVFKFKVFGCVGWIRMMVVVWGVLLLGGVLVIVFVVLDGFLVMYSGNGLFL